LESFDALGRERTVDEGFKPIDTTGALPDGSKFDDVAGLRSALVRTPERFVTTFTEKLLVYALGRGVEFHDMPAIRKIVREAAQQDYRFGSLVLGIVMGLNRTIRALVDPIIAATYPIPKSSILPLALLIFGLGESSKIFMVAIGVFFPVAINATTGVLEINKIYLDVGRNYKADRWNMFWTIALPGALPVIMTGFKLGIGIGLILIAIAEMIGAKSGLGFLIWSAWETFAVEQMYVGLFMIALIGFTLTVALNELERIIIPWKSN